MIGIFVKSLLVGYSGAVMPGSLLTYVINQSLKKGTKTGYLAIAGHVMLETLLIVLIFLGLNKIFSSDIANIIISFIGGVILLFFGISGIKDVLQNGIGISIDQTADANSDRKIIINGALLSASNPYFIIWWTTIGVVLLYEAYNLFGYSGAAIFAIGHFLADFSWYVFVAFTISKSKGFLPKKAYRIIAGVLSLALVIFGIRYIINGITLLI